MRAWWQPEENSQVYHESIAHLLTGSAATMEDQIKRMRDDTSANHDVEWSDLIK